MSLAVLAQGVLVSAPSERTAANGKTFAVAQIRVATDEDPVLASLIVFNDEAKGALLALGKGDSLAVTGRAKLTSWTGRDGESKHGISIVVERAMSAYEVTKRAKAVARSGALSACL